MSPAGTARRTRLHARPSFASFARSWVVVRGWAGEPQLQGSEHSELRWVTLDEAAYLPLAHPGYLHLFRAVLVR